MTKKKIENQQKKIILIEFEWNSNGKSKLTYTSLSGNHSQVNEGHSNACDKTFLFDLFVFKKQNF